jgi:hypothetical protein
MARKRRFGSLANELLKKAREAMLTAVQIFNNPHVEFKSELFIVTTIIAWTYLLWDTVSATGVRMLPCLPVSVDLACATVDENKTPDLQGTLKQQEPTSQAGQTTLPTNSSLPKSAEFSRLSLKRPITALICALPLIFGIFVYFFENTICTDTSDRFHIYIQFLTSNWPSYDGYLDRRSAVFAFFAAVRFTIIYGTIAGVVTTFVKVINWQNETVVRFLDMMGERDFVTALKISQHLKEAYPDIADPQEVVKAAIKDADHAWANKILPARIGKAAARKYLEK